MCMRARGFFIAVCCYAATLSAAVMPFSNFERDGRPVLVPGVQNYRSEAGSFALPRKFTVSVPAGEEIILEQLGTDLKRFPGIEASAAKAEDAVCRFILTEKGTPEHDQGYLLVIDPSGINVSARSGRGLFYGAQTLRNLLRNAAGPELRACRIEDWPDFERRGYTISLRNIPPSELPKLKRSLDALAALKINWLRLELAETFPYRNNPFTKRKNAYTEEEVREIIDFCQKRHIEISPILQIWTHTFWMTFHPDWDKMKEGEPDKAWNSQPCPLNPEARRLIEITIDEHVELFQPKMFGIGLDEIFLGPFHECPKCRKQDPVQLAGEAFKFAQNAVLKHGVRPMVCQDSFLNNSRWNYGDQLREKLDPRTIISWWCYLDTLPEEKIMPFRNFQLSGVAVAGKPFNVCNMAKLIKKYGGTQCAITHWYYSNGGLLYRLDRETPDSLGGFVNGADYLWKLTDTPYPELGYDGTFEMMRLLYPGQVTMPPRTGTAEPLPLENAVNAELSGSGKFPRFDSDAELDELSKALSDLPERFRLITSPGGKYYGLRLVGDLKVPGRRGIQFNFHRRKAEQLAFLLTASRPINPLDYFSPRVYGRKRFKYAPAATLVLKYTDGTQETVRLGYRKEITDWNRPFGGFGMRFAVRGLDADRNYYNFGIFDFKNPHPEKPIESIAFFTHRLDGISPVLLAVSAWGTDSPFPRPKRAFNPAVLAKRVGVTDKPGFTANIVEDFEHGMGKVRVTAPKSLNGKLKTEIVDDPSSPSKSKVLKITVPPGNYHESEESPGYIRISIDMPYTISATTKALILDHKLVAEDGSGFSHANDYLVGGGKYRLQKLFPTAGWIREIIDFTTPTSATRPMTDMTQTKRRRISFFFTEIKKPVEIRIDNIGDSPDAVTTVPSWNEMREAERIPIF